MGMVEISDTEIALLLSGFFWPFCRIAGFIMVDPFFCTRTIPRQVRVATAIALTIIIAPLLPAMPEAPVISAEGLANIFYQVIIGAAMGMVMRLVIAAVEMAGMLMSMQMGLGFAMFFDPQFGAQVPALSRFLSTFVFLLFLAMDGHLVLISALVDSFRILPVGLESIPKASFKVLAEWGAKIFSLGFLLSIPVVGALLITNLAIGVMTRAAPQFNIFTFGFPLTLTIGFIALYFSIPAFAHVIGEIYEQNIQAMLQLLTTIKTP